MRYELAEIRTRAKNQAGPGNDRGPAQRMTTESHFQVLFICTPAIGNLVPAVEFAERLTHHDARFSSTILVMNLLQRPAVDSYIQSRASSSAGIKFVRLPTPHLPSPDQYESSLGYLSLFIHNHKLQVKRAITQLQQQESNSVLVRPVAGLFVDMFCTSMIDIADELGIPCYLFFPSPASFLGFMLHLPTLDTKLAAESTDSSDTDLIAPKDAAAGATELTVPSFVNLLPLSVLPSAVLKRKKDGYLWYLHHARRYTETKGIVVNTFRELEHHALSSLAGGPSLYPVGPVLDIVGPVHWADRDGVMKWLDGQPKSSVVFLCFGSMGSFSRAQLVEIAIGLERAGFRFLWSIREPAQGSLDLPGEYKNINDILPEGFMDRTAGVGLVCGWAAQMSILAHEAIGGFVSHCGWNPILESLWYGVPIATWPVYAEQQMNAFQLVKELGLAVEIRLEYRKGSKLVTSEELERGIKRLMEGEEEVRRKVKEMKEKSRMAVTEGGSSYISLSSLIQNLINEVS